MIAAPVLDNDTQRVKALKSLNISEIQSEERFSRITRIAAALFNVPVARVSIVDSNREWFKSCVGSNIKESPRAISFCSHVINQDEVFVIPDSHLDERFRDNPLVTGGPRIRFYAGCPLVTTDNFKIGSFCITDTKPRIFTDNEKSLLKDLAKIVENELNSVELNNALKELENINEELDHFTYAASHDLKAPLRAIGNLSTWLEEDLAGMLDKHTTDKLYLLKKSVSRMEKLINGLLEYSKVGRDKVIRDDVNLNLVLKEITDNYKHENVSFNIEEDVPCINYPELNIQQVFANLISNSIKYNDKAKPVITVYHRSIEGYFEFTVEDNGKGIEEPYIEKIFQIFQRLEAKSIIEGTGIGLSLVKKIIEENGGTIKVTSIPGVGSKFIFTVPRLYQPCFHRGKGNGIKILSPSS